MCHLRKLWSVSQDQPLIWKNSFGGPVSWVGQSLRGSPGWGKQCYPDWWSLRYSIYPLALWLCVGRAQKRDSSLCPPFCLGKSCPSTLALMPDTSFSPCMPLAPITQLPQCWSSEGVSLSKSLWGFFKRNCFGLQQFLPPTKSLLIFAARSFEDLSSWHWNPGLGGLVRGYDSLLLRNPSRAFIHHTWMWD